MSWSTKSSTSQSTTKALGVGSETNRSPRNAFHSGPSDFFRGLLVRSFQERTTLRADPPWPLQMKAMCSQNTAGGGPARPRRVPGSCRGARAFDGSRRSRPSSRTARGSRSPPRGAGRGPRWPACGRRDSRHRPGAATATPYPRPARDRNRRGGAPQPSATARSIRSSSWCSVAASTRRGTRPLSPSALFPPPASTARPFSFNASDSRAISACAAASPGSGPPWRTPGRDAANASSAPCLATIRSFMIVRAIHPRALGRLNRAELATQPDPDLILMRRPQERLRSAASVAAC